MTMQIFIPTYGRAARQITWAGLPQELRARATLVVQEREAKLYTDYPTATLPDNVRTIATTRQWIVFTHFPKVARGEKLVMLDDDLKFQTRRQDDRGKFREATDKEKIALFAALERALDKYAHVGVVAREGGNRMLKDTECTRQMRVLGYYVPTLHKLKVNFTPNGPQTLMEDFYVTLQLLRAGYKNLVLHGWCQGQGSSNEEGGCASYRTLELHNKNAGLLAKAYPDFVRTVQKTTKTAWGGATRTDVVVSWKKAYLSSGRSL